MLVSCSRTGQHRPPRSGMPHPPQTSRGLAAAAEGEVKLPPQYSIPGRYAAALYMAAVKADKLAAVEDELSQVSDLVAQSQEFSAFVKDPSLPTQSKVEGLNAVLDKMGASDITKNFMGARACGGGALGQGWGGAGWCRVCFAARLQGAG